MADAWVKDKPRITDREYLDKVEKALANGPIFVRHALYHGGGNGHWDVYANTTYSLFRDHIRHSNPGDRFTIWSVADLIKKNLHFVHRNYEKLSLSSQDFMQDFQTIKRFLGDKGKEAFLIFIPTDAGSTEVDFNDIDGYDDLVETASKFSGKAARLYAYDLERVWVPEQILLEAKVPNASGEVPIGGAY